MTEAEMINSLVGQSPLMILVLVMLYLLIREQREHVRTRDNYRLDVLNLLEEINDIVRGIAGMPRATRRRSKQTDEDDTARLTIAQIRRQTVEEED